MEVARFSPGGTYLGVSGADGRLRLWDTATSVLKQEFVPSSHLTATCTCLEWSPCSNQVIIIFCQVSLFDTYQYNHELQSFIFIHVDKWEEEEAEEDNRWGGRGNGNCNRCFSFLWSYQSTGSFSAKGRSFGKGDWLILVCNFASVVLMWGGWVYF